MSVNIAPNRKINQSGPGMLSVRFTLMDAEKKFRRACEQIVLLNQATENLEIRYIHAKNANDRSCRYTLRLKLAVTEGVCNTYHDYAHCLAEQIARLHQKMYGGTSESSEEGHEEEMETEEL